MRKSILLPVLVWLVLLPWKGFPEPRDQNDLTRYIGMTGGFTMGYGMTYRYWEGNYGIQAVFAPYWYEEDININAGTAVFKSLYSKEHTRLFLYLAGSYYFSRFIDEAEDQTDPSVIEERTGTSHDFALGFGPGWEIFLFENIALNFMFGYGYRTDSGLNLTGEAGLYYRF